LAPVHCLVVLDMSSLRPDFWRTLIWPRGHEKRLIYIYILILMLYESKYRLEMHPTTSFEPTQTWACRQMRAPEKSVFLYDFSWPST
jgi:hypothetical protein